MEWTFGASFAFISCLYLSLVTSPVSGGKCSGKWAVHSCFGGNGKRSDPGLEISASLGADTSVDRGLLRKVLLGELAALTEDSEPRLEESNWPVPSTSLIREEYPATSFGDLDLTSSEEEDQDDPQPEVNSRRDKLEIALREMAALQRYSALMKRLNLLHTPRTQLA